MKISTLMISSTLLLAQSGFATQVYERSLADGIDNAIESAFVEVTSKTAIDDTQKISFDQIKNTIDTLKINGDKLLVSFNDEKVKSLLSSNGIATWQGLSDPVLVWFADVSENGINILNSDGQNDFAVALNEASIKNNYNLMFPLMDLDDVQSVDAQTILTHSDKKLAQSSKRYDAKYFVAGAIEKNEDTYTVKWNVYDNEGKALGNGQSQGDLATTSSNVSRDIAKALMQNDTQSKNVANTSSDEVNSLTTTQDDGNIALGTVPGGVRVLFAGVDNVADYPSIKRALITYGYEADITVLGYNQSGVIFLIPTGAKPDILDGTLAHADEFTKVGPWTYKYNKSKGVPQTPNGVGSISKSTHEMVTSKINKYGDEAYTKHSVKKKVEVTTQVVQQDGAPVITLTDDSDDSTQALESEGIAISN